MISVPMQSVLDSGEQRREFARGNEHAGQRVEIHGELLDLVDQAACLVWFDEFGHTRLLQRGALYWTYKRLSA
jgi:hypothetical protein